MPNNQLVTTRFHTPRQDTKPLRTHRRSRQAGLALGVAVGFIAP